MNSVLGSGRAARNRALPVLVGGLVAALALAACSSGSSGSGTGSGAAAGGDIKVAQITTASGGFPFGDVIKGTQSYFDMVNAKGGINGHKIVFQSGDDKGQAAEAAQLARKFVQQDGVVAFVGNTSLPDCPTNQGFYSQNKIPVIGGGTQASCFAQPFWQPVNAGPFVGHEVVWTYSFAQLKPTAACQLEQNDPTSVKYFDQLRDEFKAKTPGASFKLVTYNNDASKDPVPAVTQAKQAGCDLIMLSTVAPNLVAFVKAAKAVGLDATFICLGSCYDATLPKTLGPLGEPGALGPKSKGVYVAAELAPINDTSPDVTAMTTQFGSTSTPANFWSQIGWLSAAQFVTALTENKGGGDITTPEGVVAALKGMSEYKNSMVATPLIFGSGEGHAPNLGSKVIYIKDGDWATAPGQNDQGFTIVEPPAPPES